MSHFSLIAVLPPTEDADIQRTLTDLLMPFKEYQCGAPDPPGFREKFCVFADTTEELRHHYNTGGISLREIAQCMSWDTCIRQLKLWGAHTGVDWQQGASFISQARDRLPQGLKWSSVGASQQAEAVATMAHEARIDPDRVIPYTDLYATFLEYLNVEERGAFDDVTGKPGHWHNPNKRWDEWQIGGRFTGAFGPDIQRIVDWVEPDTKDEKDQLWALYEQYRDSPPILDPAYMDLRASMTGMGVWERNADATGFIKHPITRADFDQHLSWYFNLAPFAGVCSKGWVGPGVVGWFGCSTTQPVTLRLWKEEFASWLRKGRDYDSLMITIDCHI